MPLKTRLHTFRAVGLLLFALSPLVNASIVISNTNDGDNDTSKVWTIYGLNATPLGIGGGASTGTLDGAGLFTPAEKISITATAYYGWDSAGGSSPARNAATNGTLDAYISGLDAVQMDAILASSGGHFGVDSSSVTNDTNVTRFSGTAEAMVFTVDSSSMEPTSSLVIEELAFEQFGPGDRTDLIVYDVSAGRVVEALWDQDYSGSGGAAGGGWTVENGDLIIVATGASNTDTYRMNGLGFITLDVTSSLTEPPSEPPLVVESGPGIPNTNQVVGTLLAEFNTDSNNTDLDVRTVVLDYIDGYLYMDTRALVTDGGSHTVHTWNLSDPSNPVEAGRFGGERGMHTAQVLLPDYRVNARADEYLNVSDPLNMFYVNPPGYTVKDMGGRGCSLLPYQYSGGSSVNIHDARDGTTVGVADEHGFGALSIPIGNLLIVVGIRGQDERAVATYDISDPANPIFMDAIQDLSPQWDSDDNTVEAYEAAIWKHYIVIPNVKGTGDGDDCSFVDFSDPWNLEHVSFINNNGNGSGLLGRTRYAQFQDNIMFLGCGVYDMSPLDSGGDPALLDVHEHNGEYMLPLGNLFVSAENSEQGTIPDFAGPYRTRIFAHQAAPDSHPPTVAYHSPTNGAIGQHVKTRIGVIIHETLRYKSVNTNTFRVFPLPNGPDLTGTLNATDKDIITFTPDSVLAESTTYRVKLNGIQDAVGNSMASYSFDFTTAAAGDGDPITIIDISSTPYPAPVAGATDFSVLATNGLAPLEYSWDFGDGSPPTTFRVSDANISHTYTNAGHYYVQVQLRDSGVPARTASKSMVATVTVPPAGAPATKGGPIILDQTNRLVWCVNPDNNTVTAINADTLAKVHEFSVGNDPRGIALDDAGNLWITCLDDDRLETRDGSSGALIDTIDFGHGSRPHDVVFNNRKEYAYVTLKGGGKVARIDPTVSPLRIDVVLNAGPTPAAIAVNANTDQILVNRFISPDAGGEVRLFNNADSPGIGLETTISLDLDTTSIEDGQQGRGVPNYLADIAIDPLNQFAYVTAKKDNILRGGFRDGQALTSDTTVRTLISKIDLSSQTEIVADRLDIDDSSQPTALAFSPLGDYLFIAMQGNNEVKVLDTYSGSIIATLSTGFAPQGLAFDAVTDRLFVKNLNDRTITIFDLTDALTKGDFDQPALATINTVSSELFAADVLLGKQIFYNADDERMSFEGYLSCAICHQDGDHDGRTWDFTDRGEGLRNTTNLRGRSGNGHGNVHWSANFNEIQDFELDMVNAFGGDGFLAELGGPNPSMGASNAGISTNLDALAAYVTSLGVESVEKSPYRNSNGSLTPAAVTGKRLFEGTLITQSGNALTCASCHNPATEFTDSVVGRSIPPITLHDVGTIKPSSGQRLGGGTNSLVGIDSPTLLGLHASAPYLHDGGAETVAAVFGRFDAVAPLGQDGSAHDLSVSGYNLTTDERDDLIAYLNQIDGTGVGDLLGAWLVSHGLGSGAETNDTDGDGLMDLGEYALGGDPTNDLDVGWQPTLVGAEGIFYYVHAQRIEDPSLIYTVESSTNLATAAWTNAGYAIMGTNVGATLDFVTNSIPPGHERLFLRLRIDQ